jgi:hypothetical protein
MGEALPYWPRLMTRRRAATYCDMSESAFTSRCPVPPLDFGDRRMERFDREELDEWISALRRPGVRVKSVEELVAEFSR